MAELFFRQAWRCTRPAARRFSAAASHAMTEGVAGDIAAVARQFRRFRQARMAPHVFHDQGFMGMYLRIDASNLLAHQLVQRLLAIAQMFFHVGDFLLAYLLYRLQTA